MQFRDLNRQYEYLKTDIDRAISDVLMSSRYISGPQVGALEEQLAEYVGVKHCVTCANGTDALTLALMAWGIGTGDAVFVPDFTFFSSGESPAAVGATPVFVDVEPDTFNMNPESLETAIKRVLDDARYTPRVVIAVDLFGQPADYDRIRAICDRYDLLLLEDGAQGFGSAIRGKKPVASEISLPLHSFRPNLWAVTAMVVQCLLMMMNGRSYYGAMLFMARVARINMIMSG